MGNITEAREKEIDPIVKLFQDYIIQDHESQSRRGYLGMSSLGGSCVRKEYYNNRWVSVQYFSPTTLNMFKNGHNSEPEVFKRLRAMGVKIWDLNEDGSQFSCVPRVGNGHIRGHLDAVAKGLPGYDPETAVLLDVKVSKTLKYNELASILSSGVEKPLLAWNPNYYGQAQLYMRSKDLQHACYLVFSPGLFTVQAVYADRDLEYSQMLLDRGVEILKCKNVEDLSRVSTDEQHVDCNFCGYSDVCYGKKLPDINCRTCVHSEVIFDEKYPGKWGCNKHKSILKNFDACKLHIYNPNFLSNWASVADVDDSLSWVKYYNISMDKYFVNATESEEGVISSTYTSKEIKESYDLDGPQYLVED
jgi:hypothetical protein